MSRLSRVRCAECRRTAATRARLVAACPTAERCPAQIRLETAQSGARPGEHTLMWDDWPNGGSRTKADLKAFE